MVDPNLLRAKIEEYLRARKGVCFPPPVWPLAFVRVPTKKDDKWFVYPVATPKKIPRRGNKDKTGKILETHFYTCRK